MSHIVTIKTEVRDITAIRQACHRLKIDQPQYGTHKLFAGESIGHAVQLPGWRYPAVFDTESGTVHYDDYNGQWGEQKHLDAFLQSYAVEKAKIEARRRGHSCTEQSLTDGSIKLTINVGGCGMTKTIEIVVSPEGEAKVETKGFSGAECQEASKFIEQALGQPGTETLTTEYHHHSQSSVTQQQKQ